MINRTMLFGYLVILTLLFTGCAKNRLVFGTYTEFDVAGIEAKPTGDIALKIGYDRGEMAYVPDNGQDGYSVLGTFDSDVKLFSGYYVSEVFATGEAADIASAGITQNGNDSSGTTNNSGANANTGGSDINGNTDSLNNDLVKPLLLTTGTRFGFHSLFSRKEGAMSPFDVMLGYKRANFAVVPTKKGVSKARSVYADIVIGEGSRRSRAAIRVRAPEKSAGSVLLGEGIIINQRIATGQAAKNLAGKEEIQNKLIILENALKTANDLRDEIKKEVERLSKSENQGAFKQARLKLAGMTGADSNGISSDNFIQTAQAYLDIAGQKKLLNFLKELQ